MGILLMIVLGAIAGFIATYVMKSPHGLLMDILLGIVGAVIGGLIMSFFGQPGVYGFNLYSLFVAVLGAIVVIFVARMFSNRKLA